jgi:hypothetical protein
MEQNYFSGVTITQLVKKFPFFYGSQGSLVYSQQPATGFHLIYLFIYSLFNDAFSVTQII